MDVHVNVYARVRSITFADVQKRKMCASGIVCNKTYLNILNLFLRNVHFNQVENREKRFASIVLL
jgi:hypothetical protein